MFLYRTNSGEQPKSYDIWGAAVLEVELDVLTGQFLVRNESMHVYHSTNEFLI